MSTKNIKNVVCILVLLVLTVQTLKWQVNPINSKLQDQHGRYRVTHGVNVVYKQKPFLPRRSEFNFNDSLVRQDLQNLQYWGFNSIRLFIAWEGFEPQQGQYNYTYLEELKKIVRQAEQFGINVLLDAHQDLFSRQFCGEGFPTWLGKVTTFPSPIKVDLEYDSQGFPTKQSCMKQPFFKYYLTEDVMKFSNDFFLNKNGMLDKFIKMWEKVVMYFLPENNLIGYDIINEPSGATVYKSVYEYLGPGMNNNKFLLPLYKKISKAIRKIDQTKFLFFEPSVADILGGFYDSPSQQPHKRLDVISYHTYCPMTDSYGSNKCKLLNEQYTELRHKNAKQLRIGLSVTQFGSVANATNDMTEIKNVMEMTESHLTSWYYWQFKYNADSTSSTHPPQMQSFYYPDGQLQQEKVKILGHPYAYAICGQNSQESWDQHFYQLTLTARKCLNQKNTEIFINQNMYFKKGFEVEFKPQCPECYLKAVEGTSRSFYQIVMPKSMSGLKVSVKIVGYIEKETQQ